MSECDIFQSIYADVTAELLSYGFGNIIKIILSVPKSDIQRVTARPITLKSQNMWQFEKIAGDQAFHENIPMDKFREYFLSLLCTHRFREVNALTATAAIHFRVTKKCKLFRDVAIRSPGTSGALTPATRDIASQRQAQSHDRQKSYILAEGMPVKPFVDLGIFDANYRIVKSKYNKFRQINRFIEIIADEFEFGCDASCASDSNEATGGAAMTNNESICDSLTIVDFGCGKSYLTFFVYYYFVYIMKMNVHISGYDIKKNVVSHCNEIAEKYGYGNLKFYVGDVADIPDILPNGGGKADLLISLHACDTATDHALYYAIKNKIRRVFCVPCCQHEVNAQIMRGSEFAPILRHGLYKERFSALLTDSIRCEILRNMGYDVDVVEFVGIDNTPKNAMIRARLTREAADAVPGVPIDSSITKLMADFHITQTLVDLMQSHIG